MTQRIDYMKQSPELFKKFVDFSMALKQSAIEETTRHLVDIRASQINGCAFCVDMHVKEAVMHGERALRLHHIATWRESNLFNERERAALGWTEAITLISDGHAPDEAYEKARAHFSEAELVNLTLAITAINGWNRLNIAFRVPAGDYKPGMFKRAMGE